MNWAGLYATLYHGKRRAGSYEHAFRDILLEEQSRKLKSCNLAPILEKMGIEIDKLDLIRDIIEKGAKGINGKYVASTSSVSRAKNALATVGRKFNAVSKQSAFNNVVVALADIKGTLVLGESIVGGLLLNALATDEAAVRVIELRRIVESMQNMYSRDPMLLEGLKNTETNILAAQSKMGAFAVSVNDNLDEITQSTVSLGLTLSDVAFKFNPVFAAYLWSLELTYVVLKNISNQWELAQDASTIATASTMLHDCCQMNSGFNNMEFYGQSLFYGKVIKLLNTTESKFKAIIDGVFSGGNDINDIVDQCKQRQIEIDKYLASLNSKTNQGSPSDKVVLGLILDSSGSMEQNDPNDSRKVAAGMIIDRLSGGENIFLVDFDDKNVWLNPSNWKGWKKEDLHQAVNTIDHNGGTNIGGGIAQMRNAFESAGISSGKNGVLLLTDGLGEYHNEAEWFKQHQIPIYTISFVGDNNSQLLSTIASETGGQYIKANSAAEIVNAFNQFFSAMKGSSSICLFNGSISQGQTIEELFQIDIGTKELYALSTWPGSTIGATLISPNGKIYQQGGSGAEWFVGDRYVSVKIQNPEHGQWKAKLVGVSIPQAQEPFNFEVDGDSPLEVLVEDKTTDKGPVVFDMGYNAGDVNAQQITSAISVTTPKGETKQLTSSFNNNRFVYHPLSGSGNYKFRMEVNGKTTVGDPFQRHYSRTVLVGNYIPAYIGLVQRLVGTYLIADRGSNISNRAGLKCFVYPPDGSKENKIAIGIVTSVKPEECTIEIQEFFGSRRPAPNDIIEIDALTWMNDTK
jgi:Mg-chelatase subunit ChlD